MPKKPKTYPIEKAAEKLLNEVRLSLRKATAFFFEIPKKKDDKMIFVLETTIWLLFTVVIIWRILER
jgi:hypothetical protein